MKKNMHVLFVSRFLPHPKVRDSGGQDTYHYIASLVDKGHNVSLIAFVLPEDMPGVAEMQEICREVLPIPYQPHTLFLRLWRAAWRLVFTRVYGRVFSFRYLFALQALLHRTHFDVVVVDGMMALYSTLVSGPAKVLDEVDIYSSVAYQLYRNSKRFLERLCARLDWLRTTDAELKYARNHNAVLIRSHKDRIVLENLLHDQNFFVLSPWFEGLADLQHIELTRPLTNNLLFVGAMKNPSNIEAILYFAKEIYPLIQERIEDLQLYIVGSAPTPVVQQLGHTPGIVVTGAVEDLTPYYQMCSVNVVPLLTGGGIIVKALNGLAAGRPTVATAVGNSGTGAVPGRDLLVPEHSPNAFADAVVKLLTDEVLWYQIARQGREFVQKTFDFDTMISDFADFLAYVSRDMS